MSKSDKAWLLAGGLFFVGAGMLLVMSPIFWPGQTFRDILINAIVGPIAVTRGSEYLSLAKKAEVRG